LMNYEWDPNKARSNYKKHGVRFADAVGVFEDENAITIQDEHESEDRSTIPSTVTNCAFLLWGKRNL
jgi:uncharacterized DUF497 family protein